MIILLIIIPFLIGLIFGWLATSSHYEKRITEGEFMSEPEVWNDRWVMYPRHKMTKRKLKKLKILLLKP